MKDDVVTKDDKTPVTLADFAAQAVISHRLYESFPSIPLMGEEDADALRQNTELAAKVCNSVKEVAPEMSLEQTLLAIDRGSYDGGSGLFWVLDPIDGTKGFLRKEQYAVCLGLIEDGKCLISVLGCPNLPLVPELPDGELGCLFIAVRGQGATMRAISSEGEQRISVSPVDDCSQAPSVESVESGHSHHSQHSRVRDALMMRPPVRMDSQCKFGVVARGEASLYLRFSKGGSHHKLWDIAAGAMLVEEAGGRVSDGQGFPLNFALGRTVGVSDLFASNGLLHAKVLETIQEVAASL